MEQAAVVGPAGSAPTAPTGRGSGASIPGQGAGGAAIGIEARAGVGRRAIGHGALRRRRRNPQRTRESPSLRRNGRSDRGCPRRADGPPSFSKVLFPAVRVGYLVLPPDLVEPFVTARALALGHGSLIEQRCAAHRDRHPPGGMASGGHRRPAHRTARRRGRHHRSSRVVLSHRGPSAARGSCSDSRPYARRRSATRCSGSPRPSRPAPAPGRRELFGLCDSSGCDALRILSGATGRSATALSGQTNVEGVSPDLIPGVD
jgi:hypothetical protein